RRKCGSLYFIKTVAKRFSRFRNCLIDTAGNRCHLAICIEIQYDGVSECLTNSVLNSLKNERKQIDGNFLNADQQQTKRVMHNIITQRIIGDSPTIIQCFWTSLTKFVIDKTYFYTFRVELFKLFSISFVKNVKCSGT